jgi:nitrite reductase/ring-hydroxylating ferredoxin subunit
VTRQVVARASEVAPGTGKIVTVRGRDIGIFNVGGEYFALANRCPHAGGPLCRGRIVALVTSEGPGHYQLARHQEFLRCPWHGWEFDIRTGQSWCDPNSVRARQFAVSVEPGAALVKGPYVAETFAISVEEDYLVIDLAG